MRKGLKRYRVLILALSVLMSFCLAYPQNDNLGEIRFLSSKLILGGFEPADREDPVVDSPDQSKGIVAASCVNLGLHGIQSFEDSYLFPFQPFSFEKKLSILRC